uniref:Replication protein A C-terminal domain-containing protein n=1 Tax=Babesia bovis TaxID=5865 RepID=S6BFF4_BABBO|nr:conserved hypothetical protein [Babesia bovis]
MFGGLGDHDAFGANWNLDEIQQLDDITAGGFLDDDADHLADDSTTTHQKVAPSRLSLMPVKITMIVNEWYKESGYIAFSNKIPDIIKILGRVERYMCTDENTQFVIDDGTARITCVYVHTNNLTPFRQKQLERVMQTTKMVVVYGSYNPVYSVKCPVLVIYKIREIYTANEFALHHFDVVNLILRNERESSTMQVANPIDSMPVVNIDNHVVGQMENMIPSGQPTNVQHQPPKMDADGGITLMRFIARTLAEETRKGNLNGITVTEITQRCNMHRNFQSITEQHVRKVLFELEKDASVYQTIDANTYASTDA